MIAVSSSAALHPPRIRSCPQAFGSASPNCTLTRAGVRNACKSVLAEKDSTPFSLFASIVSVAALPPPPPADYFDAGPISAAFLKCKADRALFFPGSIFLHC